MNKALLEVKDIIVGDADFFLDLATKSEIFKTFPILSHLVAGVDVIKSISDEIYLRKISAFFEGLKKKIIDKDSFDKAIKTYTGDKKRFGATLVFLVEKAENDEKAHLLGFLTGLLLDKKIDIEKYTLFTNIVNNIQILYLQWFSTIYTDEIAIKNSSLYFVLSSQGLIEFKEKAKLALNGRVVERDTGLTELARELGDILSEYFKK